MKLSAKGRKELARISSEHYLLVLVADTTKANAHLPAGGKMQILYRVKSAESAYRPLGKIKDEVTVEKAIDFMGRRSVKMEEKYALFNKADRLVALATAAIEEGDSDAGFCKECLAPANYVEPDAEGYPCEACGQSAVVGAEMIVLRYGGLF